MQRAFGSRKSTEELKSLLSRAVKVPDEQIDLAEASLLLARREYSELDVSRYLRQLDSMSVDARIIIGDEKYPAKIIKLLNGYFFNQLGFQGNRDNYYDPQNSFLNRVIARRSGIPITLSIVYMRIARQAGFELVGVGLPSHFVVKYSVKPYDILIDVFNGGRILTEEDCRRIVEQASGGGLTFSTEYLKRSSNREILTRILNNLKGIYFHNERYEKVAWVLEFLEILNPDSRENLRDYGQLYYLTGEYTRALQNFERYLAEMPAGPDADYIRKQVSRIRTELARLT